MHLHLHIQMHIHMYTYAYEYIQSHAHGKYMCVVMAAIRKNMANTCFCLVNMIIC